LKIDQLVQADCCMASREQRADQRQACDLPVEWDCFNASENFHGRMTDVSGRGCCVESGHPVTAGAAVIVRVLSSDGSGTDRTIQSLLLAEVKWCRPLPLESSWQYQFGVKCFEYL
jgi:hypothetical protein